MPMLLEHIDAIARSKQRDVLYVEFHPRESDIQDDDEGLEQRGWDWKTLPIRQQVIDWLDARGIAWRCCGPFADPGQMAGYRGQIYVDVPFNEGLPVFQAVQAFLELPDGAMRYPEASFYCCPLAQAMKNAAHDEPGFWARWAETF